MSSRSLCRALSAPPSDGPALTRLACVVLAYRLRMSHRPTPFGLLAGVAAGRFGDSPHATIGHGRRLSVRPDAGWLAGLAAARADATGGLDRAVVRTDPTLTRHGDRHLLRRLLATPAGTRYLEDVSVGGSVLVDAVLSAAAGGRPVQELVALIRAAAPALSEGAVTGLVRDLVRHGLLVADLRPPPGSADPFGRLRGPDLDPIRAGLRRIAGQPPAAGHRPVVELSTRMAAVHPGEQVLHVDLALDADVALPASLAREVERAVDVALRCAPGPAPPGALARYHGRFLERYGCDHPVPLLDLLDEVTGLGPLPTEADPDPVPGQSAERRRLLMRLAVERPAEIVLAGDLLDRVAATGAGRPPGPSMELHAQLLARSVPAIEAGDFLLAVGPQGGSPLAGTGAGRFAGLLGPALAPAIGDPAGPCAEVVFWPVPARLANVAPVTGWAPYRIPVGTATGAPGELALGELAVSATTERLVLTCPRLRTPLVPVSFSQLDPAAAPPVARLLLEIGRQGRDRWRPWDWGAAADLPYLPRVRTGRTVLAPATWAVPAELATAARQSGQGWSGALQDWRSAAGVPAQVLAGTADRRLPLDLDDPLQKEILRRALAAGAPAVTELPGGPARYHAQSWLRGPDGPHVGELVFALHRRGGRTAATPARPVPTARPVAHLPGGEWLYAKVFGPARWQDDVLASLADKLLPAQDVDRWFFLRYVDPGDDGGPHLRLRFHGRSTALTTGLLPRLHGWVAALTARNLSRGMALGTYRPEAERFGGPAAMAAAERVFAADSERAIGLLRAAPAQLVPVQWAAIGAIALTEGLLGAWSPDRLPAVPRLGRLERAAVSELRPAVRRLLAEDAPSGDRLLRRALAAYRPLLPTGSAAGVARVLVHLHCNRLLGTDPSAERIALALARDAGGFRSSRMQATAN